MDHDRLRTLAGVVRETAEPMGDEEAERMRDEEDSAAYGRERKVEELVGRAFSAVGLHVDRVIYTGDDRNCWVAVDDYEAPLSALAKLLGSGLAEDFQVKAGERGGMVGLDIEFTVLPGIEDAEFAPGGGG